MTASEYPEGAVVRAEDMGPVERAYAEAMHDGCEDGPAHPMSAHSPWSGGDLDGTEPWPAFMDRLARHGLTLALVAATPEPPTTTLGLASTRLVDAPEPPDLSAAAEPLVRHLEAIAEVAAKLVAEEPYGDQGVAIDARMRLRSLLHDLPDIRVLAQQPETGEPPNG